MPRFPVVASIALLSLLRAMLGAAAPAPKTLSPDLRDFYIDLHQNPELSLHEEKTAAKLAERLRKLGFEVTTNVGGTGVVGVLKNGPGPTCMLRTDMDALPVAEKTGLPYASKVRRQRRAGTRCRSCTPAVTTCT